MGILFSYFWTEPEIKIEYNEKKERFLVEIAKKLFPPLECVSEKDKKKIKDVNESQILNIVKKNLEEIGQIRIYKTNLLDTSNTLIHETLRIEQNIFKSEVTLRNIEIEQYQKNEYNSNWLFCPYTLKKLQSDVIQINYNFDILKFCYDITISNNSSFIRSCPHTSEHFFSPCLLPAIRQEIEALSCNRNFSHHFQNNYKSPWPLDEFKATVEEKNKHRVQRPVFPDITYFKNCSRYNRAGCHVFKAMNIRIMIEMIYQKLHIRNLLIWSLNNDSDSYIAMLPLDILKIILKEACLLDKEVYNICFFPCEKGVKMFLNSKEYVIRV